MNADLGGLAGHKVTLYVCENQSTPAGGQTAPTTWCSTASSPWSSPSPARANRGPTIVGAGIPYITISGGSTAELTTPGAFDLEGGFPPISVPWR